LFANGGLYILSGFSRIHLLHVVDYALVVDVQEEIEAPIWVDFLVEAKSNYQDVLVHHFLFML
jgi:hypothetical protein